MSFLEIKLNCHFKRDITPFDYPKILTVFLHFFAGMYGLLGSETFHLLPQFPREKSGKLDPLLAWEMCGKGIAP